MKLRYALLALLVFDPRAPVAWACSCIGLDGADLGGWVEMMGGAYVGEVIGVDEDGGCGGTGETTVTIRVTEAFAGVEVGEELARQVNVGEGSSCGVEKDFYEVGDSYLFWGVDEVMSSCSQHLPIDEADALLTELRALFPA